MRIAFLGASSQIAKGLLREFSLEGNCHLNLFTRDTKKFKKWMSDKKFSYQSASINSLDHFNNSIEFDLIINFIGVGDPAKAIDLGSKIFDITYDYDKKVLDYLTYYPNTKYIFISSGVVYGDIFRFPATLDSQSLININSLNHSDWYSMAKINAEARHRSLDKFSIMDIRVFNYVSCDIDTSSRFLIADALRAISTNQTMQTDEKNIMRDYIGPQDLHQLINKLASQNFLNTAVDCFTKDPTDKFSILELMKSKFGLKYKIKKSKSGLEAYGSRDNYYSQNYVATTFGYKPAYSSLENISLASEKLLC